jgi:hypothetical protein
MAKAPYKYSEDIIIKTNEYISSCSMAQMELPTVEGLALFLEVNDDTIVEWSKTYEEFGELYKKLMMTQKVQLINNGAYGGKEVNTAMFIFLLKNNHNMKDRTDVTTNDKELPVPIYGGKSTE